MFFDHQSPKTYHAVHIIYNINNITSHYIKSTVMNILIKEGLRILSIYFFLCFISLLYIFILLMLLPFVVLNLFKKVHFKPTHHEIQNSVASWSAAVIVTHFYDQSVVILISGAY